MITGIDRKSVIKELKRQENLPDYWGQYFSFEKDTELFEMSKNEFQKEINEQKERKKPYIDSKIVINKILTIFGNKNIFHRKFNERHSDLHKEQVLGMQLYKMLVEDKDDIWTYYEIQHKDHVYPNATYFIEKV